MENNNFILPSRLYYKSLKTINGINFTHREIDIITYVLSGRSAKSIAYLLSISPKTVETHIRNIMIKLEVNSKESIITFIENSDKFSILKKYYVNLLTQTFFENQLKKIRELFSTQAPVCHLIYWNEPKKENGYIQPLERHLKLVGSKVLLDPREDYGVLFSDLNDLNFQSVDYLLYWLPEKILNNINGKNSSSIQHMAGNNPHLIFLFSLRELERNVQEQLGNNEHINFSEQENYYYSFFKLLNKLNPTLEINKIIAEFENHCRSTYHSFEVNSTCQSPLKEEDKPDTLSLISSLKIKHVYALLSTFFVIGWIGFFSVFWKSAQPQLHTSAFNSAKVGQISIRSGLILPAEATLLIRPELLSQIEKGFKTQQAIQTVVLTGIAGSGKTTIARLYAYKQKANVVWEINAETKESLRRSFEALAQALSTEEEQKFLRAIQGLNAVSEREDKIIQFVKQHLRVYPKWLLLYDNVEKFSDIQKFFPQDKETWGAGKVILTTRDSHILTNSYVNYAIPVGELNSEQCLKLYRGIMKTGHNRQTAESKQDLKTFLEKIPPFPLDVSIAAYYMKTTNIPYNQYLDRLNKQNKDFFTVQKHILKETTDYTDSRYNLIALSLKNIINVHKDFAELILLTSLLDSQNIPREILDTFKDKEIVDNFIYNLKKYSLISNNLYTSPLGPTFSIHRSTQAISLEYLRRYFHLENNKHLIEKIAYSLANYSLNIMESEDFLRTKSLVNQLDNFLKHEPLLNNLTIASIKCELGCVYCRIKDFERAEILLKEALSTLNKNYPKNFKIAQTLLYLGNTYQELGNYQKARAVLNQARVLYQKSSSANRYIGEARALSFLGCIHRYFGNYKKAAAHLEQSYNIYKKHGSENHVGAIFALSHLGVLQGALGNNEQAKDLLEKSFLAYKERFSESSVRAAWVLAHLGSIYKNLGEYEKANKLLEKTLIIYKAHFPEQNLAIAWVLTHLGSVQLELGNYTEAKRVLEKSLKIHQKNLKEGHPKIAWTLLNLGRVYAGLSQVEEGQSLLEKSLKSCEAQKEKNSMEIARVLSALGELYFVKNQIEISEKYLLKSLKIFLSNKHPDIYMIFENLAELELKKSMQAMQKPAVFHSQKHKAQAVAYLNRAFKVLKAHFPMDSPHKARIELKLQKLK